LCVADTLRPFVLSRLKRITGRLLLMLLSALLGLLACEGLLRVFHPRYDYAANARREASATRIWARTPNTRYTRLHPDTERPHPVIHNNFGLRQHRNFPPESLRDAVNVAFFGDSFTENPRVAAPCAFTEPLDYLLNLGGQSFNVLNFGVDGYGPDQAYLAYREFPQRERLSDVLYVFCSNDVRNIRESNLFDLAPDGALSIQPARRSSWGVRLLARFHLTYLVIETLDTLGNRSKDRLDLPAFIAHQRHRQSADLLRLENDFRENRTSSDLTATLQLMQAILRQWQHEVEAHGGRFHVVILPVASERFAMTWFTAAGFPVLDLGTGIEALAPVSIRPPIVFRNDGHWNEYGNMLAAMQLRQQLGTRHGLPADTPAEMRTALDVYYSAFDGWKPAPEAGPNTVPPGVRELIRRKYTALE
jgi:hypothetical protein